ncbi:MAG: hypothetical protein Q7S79_01770 [bacterium]|nr:hypothetical protein [bacterium]
MIQETRDRQLEPHDLELLRLRGKLAEIRGPEHLEQPLKDLEEFFEQIATRIEGRVQRVLDRVHSREVSMSRFDEELRGVKVVEVTLVSGGSGAGKSYVDELFNGWAPTKGGVETREVSWEKHGLQAGRVSTDPKRRINTPSGVMLPAHELRIGEDHLEESLYNAISGGALSIHGELAPSVFIQHDHGNDAPAIIVGKARGFWTVYNLLHRKGRFSYLPEDLQINVNLAGIVGGYLVRNVLVYFREDIGRIDIDDSKALEKAAVIAAAYQKKAPRSLEELARMLADGASPKQVELIEEENNHVVATIRHMLLLPKKMNYYKTLAPASLKQVLRSNEGVRSTLRASHLAAMFSGLGQPADGVTLSTFVGINDPQFEQLGLDLEAIKAWGDVERRRKIERVEQKQRDASTASSLWLGKPRPKP